MNARAATAKLFGYWHGSYGLARCPAHHDLTPSLSIRDGDTRLLVKCHAGCTQEAVIAALRGFCLWDTNEPAKDHSPAVTRAMKALHGHEPAPRPQPRQNCHSDWALLLWDKALPPASTVVDAYLKNRGITGAIPETIRYDPALPYRHECRVLGTWPAMVVRLDDAAGNLCGIQRTWLDPRTAKKACVGDGLPSRKTLGTQGVCWLGRRDAPSLIIAEGVETALSYSEYAEDNLNLPSWWGLPAVATCGASGLARFVPPATVREIFIAEDDDEAGRKAAKTLGDRAIAAGLKASYLRTEPR